jgi:hypothetical protein
VTKSLSSKQRDELRSYIGALQAEIRRCQGLLGDGYVIGPWLLETIRKTSDPKWYARACWAIGIYTALPRDQIDIGFKRGELRPVDFMDDLYEIVIKSPAFTREIAEAVAQSVVSQLAVHKATSPRLRTGPGRYHDFYWCGKQYPMRGKEYGLLRHVWRSRGRVARVADIFRKVWRSHNEVGTNELDCVEGTVKRVRKKLQDTPVGISFSRADDTVSIEIHWPVTGG